MSLFRYYYSPGTTPSAAPGATFAETVLAKSPSVWCRFGEPSGTTATDEQGTRNGTYENTPTLGAAGVVGDADTAVTLARASSQHISFADNAVWDVGTSDFSVMLGMRATTYPPGEAGAHERLFCRGNGAGGGDYGALFNGWYPSTEPTITFSIAGTEYNVDIATMPDLFDGNDHLLIFAFDRSANLTIWFDSTANSTTTDISGQSATDIASDRQFAVGAETDPSDINNFDGTVDEFAFWPSTLLSSADADDIFTAAGTT